MYFVLNCNVLALLSFYALPSGGNQKTRWSKVHKSSMAKGQLKDVTGAFALKPVLLSFFAQISDISEVKKLSWDVPA